MTKQQRTNLKLLGMLVEALRKMRISPRCEIIAA